MRCRFVFLPDCGHTIEVKGLDQWMEMRGDSGIEMKRCPRCVTIIRKCSRYGVILKRISNDNDNIKIKSIPLR